MPIQRKQGQQREPGHLKKLYCIYCGEEVNHAEIREIGGYTVEDFKREYAMGRFVDGQRVESEECTCQDCEFNVDGRCWNSNKSNNCGHRPVE